MEKGSLNREVVVARAAKLADGAGFDSVSLAAVARSFGVQTPSLYGHVRDLAALRDGITALALDELSERITDLIAGRSGREALRGFASAHREYANDHPGRWQSLQRPAGPEASGSPAAARIVRVTRAVLLGYDLPEPDLTHVIRIVGGALNGFLNLERIGSFAHSSPAPAQSWEELLDSLHFLLTHWHLRAGSAPLETP